MVAYIWKEEILHRVTFPKCKGHKKAGKMKKGEGMIFSADWVSGG